MIFKPFAFVLFIFIFPSLTWSFPKLFFESSEAYDRICSVGFDFEDLESQNSKYNPKWGQEIKERIHEFKKKWEDNNEKLFIVLINEFKKDFSRQQYSAVLSSCPDSPSMPKPLVYNVSRYLNSFSTPEKPKDMDLFIDVVFHELLHIWIEENRPKKAPMLEKYKKENRSVLSHLYLFAMQDLIYEKAGYSSLWKQTKEFFKQKGGSHKKALEILEKETRSIVLKDLR